MSIGNKDDYLYFLDKPIASTEHIISTIINCEFDVDEEVIEKTIDFLNYHSGQYDNFAKAQIAQRFKDVPEIANHPVCKFFLNPPTEKPEKLEDLIGGYLARDAEYINSVNKIIHDMNIDEFIAFRDKYKDTVFRVPNFETAVDLHQRNMKNYRYRDFADDYYYFLMLLEDDVDFKNEVKSLPKEKQDYVFDEIAKEIEYHKYGYNGLSLFAEYAARQDLMNKALIVGLNDLLNGEDFYKIEIDKLTQLSDEAYQVLEKVSKSRRVKPNDKVWLLSKLYDKPNVIDIFRKTFDSSCDKIVKAFEDTNPSFNGDNIYRFDDKLIGLCLDNVKDRLLNVDDMYKHYQDINHHFLSYSSRFWVSVFNQLGKKVSLEVHDANHLSDLTFPIEICLYRSPRNSDIETELKLLNAMSLSYKGKHKLKLSDELKPFLEKLITNKNDFKTDFNFKEIYDYVVGKPAKQQRKFGQL